MFQTNNQPIAPPLLMKSVYWGRDISNLLDTILDKAQGLNVNLVTQQASDNNGYVALSQVDQLQLGFIRYGASVQLQTELDDSYIFIVSFGGKHQIKDLNGNMSVSKSVTLLPQSSKLELIYSGDCDHLALRFLPTDNHRNLLAPMFEKPIETVNDEPVNTAIYNTCANFLTDCDFAADKASVRERIRILRTQLLGLVKSSSLARQNITTKINCAVNSAINFIRENPHWDYSVEELSDLMQVSPRTLYDQFKKHTGTTPYRYYKNLKLGRARLDLIKYGNELSITEIASFHGFSHLGRFSSEYRKVFGELPTSTVQLAHKLN